MAKTEYLEDRRKRRWFAGGQAYVIFMLAILAVMFTYQRQEESQQEQFIHRVCVGLEHYRKESNTRREYVHGVLEQAIEQRKKTGPPLTKEEQKQAQAYLKGFSAIPPVDDCEN